MTNRKIGCYQHLPADEYHAEKRLSASAITHGMRSMSHLRHCMTTQTEPSDAMKFGTLIHAAVLEPHTLRGQYVVMPDLTENMVTEKGDPTTSKNCKVYRERLAKWESENADKETISQGWWDAMMTIAGNVAAHKSASKLAECEHKELSILWETMGVPCKSRIDAYGDGILIDVKTTRDASMPAFGWDAMRRGYYRQLAFYSDALTYAGHEVREVWIVAIENTAPYEVAVYELGPEHLNPGREEYEGVVHQYAECLRTGKWPGYSDSVQWMDAKPRGAQQHVAADLGDDGNIF